MAKRLIDAEALGYTRVRIFHGLKEDGTPCVGGWNAVVMSSAIRQAPTVDAVEVVRCRDCRYYFHYGKTSISKNVKAGWCQRRTRCDEEIRMAADDFCSYGERRRET